MPGCLMFHIVTDGECWVESTQGGRQRLRAGDFALIPHGRGRSLPEQFQPGLRELVAATPSLTYLYEKPLGDPSGTEVQSGSRADIEVGSDLFGGEETVLPQRAQDPLLTGV